MWLSMADMISAGMRKNICWKAPTIATSIQFDKHETIIEKKEGWIRRTEGRNKTS